MAPKYVMQTEISGLRDGQPWPKKGQIVELPEAEGEKYRQFGMLRHPEESEVEPVGFAGLVRDTPPPAPAKPAPVKPAPDKTSPPSPDKPGGSGEEQNSEDGKVETAQAPGDVETAAADAKPAAKPAARQSKSVA